MIRITYRRASCRFILTAGFVCLLAAKSPASTPRGGGAGKARTAQHPSRRRAAAASSTSVQAKPFGRLALTPPMGWNSWNHFAGHVTARVLRQTADAMVASGMKAAGYRYVVVDDTWLAHHRDARGRLQPNPRRFAGGIQALAAYIHKRGLKFGIYEDAGLQTCAKYPGSLGHYRQDARTFAGWGVDYLKFDWCNVPFKRFPGLTPAQVAHRLYRRMHQALLATGRPIVFSLCEWGLYTPWRWAGEDGNLWRTTGDINDTWARMSAIGFHQNAIAGYARAGHWNDPDMLEVGNGGMTPTEYRTHMSLWAMLAAPLMAGNDLRHMPAATLQILTNRDVIAVDQDRLGIEGHRIWRSARPRKGQPASDQEIWVKPLAGGSEAVGLFNRDTAPVTIRLHLWQIGMRAPACVRDLWMHRNQVIRSASLARQVAGHGVVMLRVGPHAECN